MSGRVLLIDKAVKTGSTDVVRTIRHRFGTSRVGHAGTLDPDATGLLIVCVDAATKLVPWLTREDKAYSVVGRLGSATDSDDAAGATIATAPHDGVTREMLEAAIEARLGEREQLPPRISAIKVGGQRMHKMVRAGQDVDALRVPRLVKLDSVVLTRFEPPEFEITMDVGKGFYVRSLIRDLGEDVGSLAHVATLRRTRVGPFLATEAVGLDDIDEASGLDGDEALARVLPVVEVDSEVARRLMAGQKVRQEALPEGVFAVREGGILRAVVDAPDGVMHVVRGLG